jgi:drug/metabolite transporter (DMT)-like permease
VPAVALAFALAAAFVHAFWNLLIARARDPQAATAIALVVAEIAFAPAAIILWRVHGAAWPFLAGSTLLELAYVILLAAAYRRAPLSVVYPVARGVAPVLVLVIGILALGATASWGGVAGVLLVAAGVLLVRGLRRADTRGLAFGLAIAGTIAGYTLLDKHGIAHAGPLPYVELVMLGPAIVYFSGIARVKGLAAIRAEVGPATIAAGIATIGAYALALAALQRAAAAPVAAVRETSVVIATALAAIVLKERVGPVRLLGAALVAGGVALLSLS